MSSTTICYERIAKVIPPWASLINAVLIHILGFVYTAPWKEFVQLFRVNKHWNNCLHDKAFWKSCQGYISWSCTNCVNEKRTVPEYLFLCHSLDFQSSPCHSDCIKHLKQVLNADRMQRLKLQTSLLREESAPTVTMLQNLMELHLDFDRLMIATSFPQHLSFPVLQSFTVIDVREVSDWQSAHFVAALIPRMPQLQHLNTTIPEWTLGLLMNLKSLESFVGSFFWKNRITANPPCNRYLPH